MTYPALNCFIDGQWVAGEGAGATEVINPATEEVIGRLPHVSEAQLDRAVDAAARGLAAWRAVLPAERRRVLLRAAALLAERRAAIAATLTLEQGKPLGEALGELDRAVETFEWYAGEALRIHGCLYPERARGVRNLVVAEPVGIVAAFVPWNFPAFLSARKIAPALAAGCSIILKAAEETPGTSIQIVEALAEAGVPAGVINLVYGNPPTISGRLLANPAVRKVSFTGSAAVGKQLSRLASDHLQRCTLELGGHSPVIVFADAAIEAVATATAAFKFRNAGQVCLSPNRFFVHASVAEEFVDRFVAAARKVKVGAGQDAGVTMGPLANRRRLEAMERFTADAAARGARVAEGGKRLGNRGFFFEPTVLTGVPDDAAVMREEPFGPIAPIAAFEEVDEVVARANAVDYGLAAYVFTRDAERGQAVAARLQAGSVGINHMSPAHSDIPMGGMKDSGYGYEGGSEGLEAYLVRRHIASAANL